MKKVKIMLTALAVFAVVGGALAFKAKTFGQSVFCTTQQGQACTSEVLNATLNSEQGQNDILSEDVFCTDAAHNQDACAATTIYVKP
jgi:hypothetical protein